MADLLVSAVIPIVLTKAADSLLQRIGEMWGIDDLRERLHQTLLEIQAVLPDDEDKAISNPTVRSWLEKLKSTAYDVDDLLDEFYYEELRRDAVSRGHKVNNVSVFSSLKNSAPFRYKVSAKLRRVVEQIEGLVVQVGRFGFAHGPRIRVFTRTLTDSLVIETKVMGRVEDKDNIIKLLIEGSDNVNLIVVCQLLAWVGSAR